MKDALRLFEKDIEKMERNFDIFSVDLGARRINKKKRKRVSDDAKVEAMLRSDATVYM